MSSCFSAVGEIVAGQRRDLAPEDPRERRAGAVAFVGRERVAGDAGAVHLGAGIAGVSGERILRRAHRDRADVIAGHGVPAPDHAVGAAGEQGAAVGQERDRPHRQARTDQRARELARRLRSITATEPRMPAAAIERAVG